MFMFVYREKTYADTHRFTELRTFYKTKISVIEKKLQPSENQAYTYISGTKKTLKVRKLFFYTRYFDFVKSSDFFREFSIFMYHIAHIS